jgi:hypothetical protein
VFASIRDAYNIERDDAFNLGDYPTSAGWRCLRTLTGVTRFAGADDPGALGGRDAAGAGAGAGVVDESGRVRLGGYGTNDLPGGLDPSALEPIRSAMSGS